MEIKRVKVQVIDILGTHDTHISECFSSSRVLWAGETFEKAVEEEVAALIEEFNFDGHIKDIEWIDETNASIRFEEDEYTVLFSLTTHYAKLNIG